MRRIAGDRMMPYRKPARRKPSRHRETNELVGLWLVANFSERPQNDYELVRPLVEELLCLYDDPQLRKLYRSHFDLDDNASIPNIPVDWMLAELTGMRISDLERGRTTGRLDSCHVYRWAGRAERRRTTIDLDWFAGNDRGSEPELNLFLSLSDFPDAALPGLLEFTTRFFGAAVGTHACYYGWGNLVVMAFRNWSGGDVRHYEPADLRVARESHLWRALGEQRRGSVLGANWINLFSPLHLDSLGGRAAFLESISEFQSLGLCRDSAFTHAYPTGELKLRLSTGFPDSMFLADALASENVAAPADWAAWLECRLAGAGLLASQSPHAIWALENPHWKRADMDYSAAFMPEADGESRDAAIAAFYKQLWASPPAMLGHAAKPLDNRARSAISRSRGGHGQQMTAFDICKPGSDAPYGIWGTPDRYEAMRDPVHIGGPTAQAALCTFDSSRHGWDGEHGLAPKRRPRTPEAYHCQRCGHDRFHCRALFEYGDPDDYQDPDVAARPQDFFSWFSLVATCAQCARKKELLSVECA